MGKIVLRQHKPEKVFEERCIVTTEGYFAKNTGKESGLFQEGGSRIARRKIDD